LRARLVTAAVNFGLTAYATLTVACVKLLHCVHVPGTPPGARSLFIQGPLACGYGGWQGVYLAMLGGLVCVPPGVGLAARWALRATPTTLSTSSALVNDVRLGTRRALVDTYTGRWYWWEAALMVQRLVRACARMCARVCTWVCTRVCAGDSSGVRG
jgi:hypothetical protein